jgi:tetratricopeptide (TPR) repeat protein
VWLSLLELYHRGYWFTASTSFANPGATLARSATNTFAGIQPADVPGFIGAQLAGAAAATLLFRWLVPALRKHALKVVVPHTEADPLSPFVQFDLAWVLISAGRYDEAAVHCQNLAADYPDKSECLGRALLGQGRTDEAIQILATVRNPRYLGYVYGRAGRREEAGKLAAAVSPNAFSQALIFAGLGDKDRTLEALERTAPLGAVRIGRALISPEFALLRGDPGMKALRKKVGLPE